MACGNRTLMNRIMTQPDGPKTSRAPNRSFIESDANSGGAQLITTAFRERSRLLSSIPMARYRYRWSGTYTGSRPKLNRSKRSLIAGVLSGTYGLAGLTTGFGHVVPAAGGHRTETPVPLDKLEDGDVIRIVVRDVSRFGVGRHHHQRNARAVAEIVERLNITRVVIAAAFVEGNDNRRIAPEQRVGLHRVRIFST